MPDECLLLIYKPDPNPNVNGDRDKYRVWGDGSVRAETRFYTNSDTEIDIAGGAVETHPTKRYETAAVEFELDSETVEEYFNMVEKGLNQEYEEGPEVHIQIGESIGPENIANISKRTEPATISEVRRSLGEKGREELGNPLAFHLE